jgi:hypothetical protein
MCELNWFNDYRMNLEVDNISNYVINLSEKINEKNVENKINLIEKEYLNKLKETELLCNSPEEIKILKTKSSLVILQKELEIIKLLTKYTLQNKNLEYTFFINCLTVFLDLSETLRKRLDQKVIVHNKQYENNSILRCSYKFCSYQNNCSYYYNLKSKSLCYQDHYVHNMVSVDLKILIDYINNKYENNNIILHNKEILKTINTLSFVISHMETELRTKCLYLPESEWESCHVIKNK